MTTEVTIERAFTNGLRFLQNEEYHFEGMTVTESMASGRFYIFSFKNKKAKKEFSVAFFPQSEYVSASFTDLDNYFDFSDTGSMKIEVVSYKDIEGDFEFRVAYYLERLKEEIYAKYSDVLRGEAFKNDPFDWSPYK